MKKGEQRVIIFPQDESWDLKDEFNKSIAVLGETVVSLELLLEIAEPDVHMAERYRAGHDKLARLFRRTLDALVFQILLERILFESVNNSLDVELAKRDYINLTSALGDMTHEEKLEYLQPKDKRDRTFS